MGDFFTAVVTFISNIGTFFLNWIESLATLVALLFSAQHVPYTVASAVPGIIGSCVFAVTAVAVVKMLVGR